MQILTNCFWWRAHNWIRWYHAEGNVNQANEPCYIRRWQDSGIAPARLKHTSSCAMASRQACTAAVSCSRKAKFATIVS